MNIINALKKYNVKAGELKRLTARLKVIDLKLDNWGIIESNTIKQDEEILDVVNKKDDLILERIITEIKIAEINAFLCEIDTRIDCLGHVDKFLINKSFKENLTNDELYEEYIKFEKYVEYQTVIRNRDKALKKFSEIE